MTQIYRPKWKHEKPKLFFKQRGSIIFTKKVDSFLILPNAKKLGFKIQFRCTDDDKRLSFYYLNSFHDIDGVNKKFQRGDLAKFLKEDKKEFANVVSKVALIHKREAFFKDIDKITVFKGALNTGRFGAAKDNCKLPHYVTHVHFCDGSQFKTVYNWLPIPPLPKT